MLKAIIRFLKNIFIIVLIVACGIAMYFTGRYSVEYYNKDIVTLVNSDSEVGKQIEVGGDPVDASVNEQKTSLVEPEENVVIAPVTSAGPIIQPLSIVLFGVEGFIMMSLIMYLIISKFNKLKFKELAITGKQALICYLIAFSGTILITFVDCYITNKILVDKYGIQTIKIPVNKNKEDAEDNTNKVNEGIIVTDTNINLNDYNDNITIKNPGTYQVTGETKNHIIIDTTDVVTLNLNNVTLKDSMIINKNNTLLVIGTANDSMNSIISSKNLGISSKGPLRIGGSGTLEIQTNAVAISSEEQLTIEGGNLYVVGESNTSPIVVNNGYEINGGAVIVLGMAPIANPLESSKQYSIIAEFSNTIEAKNKEINIVNDILWGRTTKSFTAESDFKSFLVSYPELDSNNSYHIKINSTYLGYYKENKWHEMDLNKDTHDEINEK